MTYPRKRTNRVEDPADQDQSGELAIQRGNGTAPNDSAVLEGTSDGVENEHQGHEGEGEPEPLHGGDDGNRTHVASENNDGCIETRFKQMADSGARVRTARLRDTRHCIFSTNSTKCVTIAEQVGNSADSDVTFSSHGSSNAGSVGARNQTQVKDNERAGNCPVEVARIEELPAASNGSPALAREHSEVTKSRDTANEKADVNVRPLGTCNISKLVYDANSQSALCLECLSRK